MMSDQEPNLGFSVPEVMSTSVTAPSVHVPAQKLMALLSTSNAMMQSIFRHDRKETLRTAVRHVYDLLEAEACAIFLVSEDSSEELILEASYTTKSQYHCPDVRLKIESMPGKSLAGHIANKGEIVNLRYADILNNRVVP
jgi:signal transduction protein with GAF and PtsI domain